MGLKFGEAQAFELGFGQGWFADCRPQGIELAGKRWFAIGFGGGYGFFLKKTAADFEPFFGLLSLRI